MTKIITDNSKVNETLIKQNEILEAKMIRLISENRELNEQLRVADVIYRFSETKINDMALEIYPESFCWYGSSPPKHIDDNARDRILWKKGFNACLNSL